ncbi:hypothetical protein [Streptomyces sp. NBC_00454]|uniref:hypothetical protein n=1 Tax=Streptomyces sp. NBC_00454 TaxID=2975747 RepID=UPI0030DF03B2
MGSKLAVLGGIFAMALMLGLGATVGTDSGAANQDTGHHVLAEDKGPHAPTP